MRIVTRKRQEHEDADRLEERQDHYDRFVAAFGPAAGLSEQQLVALTVFCSEMTDVWLSTIAAELLRGRAWQYRDADVLNEDDPRVRRIVALATTQNR